MSPLADYSHAFGRSSYKQFTGPLTDKNKKHTYVLNALVKLCHKRIGHDGTLCSSVMGVGETCVRALSLTNPPPLTSSSSSHDPTHTYTRRNYDFSERDILNSHGMHICRTAVNTAGLESGKPKAIGVICAETNDSTPQQ